MNYEEFKTKFEDHILGRATNDRGGGSDDEEEEAPVAGSKAGGEVKSALQSSSSRAPSRTGMSASRASAMRSQKSTGTGISDLYKYDIPEACHLSMMKKVKIEKLEEKFLLVSHPYP